MSKLIQIAGGAAPATSTNVFVHAAILSNVVSPITTGITNPDVGRVVTATADGGWDGGDVTVVGTDPRGNVVSQLFHAADIAGATVVGTQLFVTVTAIKHTVIGVGGGHAVSIGIGNILSFAQGEPVFPKTALVFLSEPAALTWDAPSALQPDGFTPPAASLPNGVHTYFLLVEGQ